MSPAPTLAFWPDAPRGPASSSQAALLTSKPFSQAYENSRLRMKSLSTSRVTLTVPPGGMVAVRNTSVGTGLPSEGTKRRSRRRIAASPRRCSGSDPGRSTVTRNVCQRGRMKKGSWSMNRTLRATPSPPSAPLAKRSRYLPCVRSLRPSWLRTSRMTLNPSDRSRRASTQGAGPASPPRRSSSDPSSSEKSPAGKTRVAPPSGVSIASAALPTKRSHAAFPRPPDTRTSTRVLAAAGHWRNSRSPDQAASPRPLCSGSTTSRDARSCTCWLDSLTDATRDSDLSGDAATSSGSRSAASPRWRPQGSSLSHGVRFSVQTGS
mmetsp:Transcript_64402/g.173990  ORF Transcript_64402/g.173990 Transcript_64402/m.173990 type:complete len:321 (-) Transcript_64402:320-1282(-)